MRGVYVLFFGTVFAALIAAGCSQEQIKTICDPYALSDDLNWKYSSGVFVESIDDQNYKLKISVAKERRSDIYEDILMIQKIFEASGCLKVYKLDKSESKDRVYWTYYFEQLD